MNTELQPDHDEIDLMDLAVILSENLKTLILLPLLGVLLGASVLFWKSQQAPVFTSTSKVFVEIPFDNSPIPKFSADAIAAAINSGGAFAAIHQRSQGVQAKVEQRTRLVEINTTASTSEQAQALNAAVLEQLYVSTQNTDQTRLALLANEKQRLAEIKALIAKTAQSKDAVSIQAHGELLQNASAIESSIAQIQTQLSGLTADHVVMHPTLPTATPSGKKWLPVLAGLIGGGFIALFWIFCKHALRTMQTDPVQQSKWHTVQRNLGLRRN